MLSVYHRALDEREHILLDIDLYHDLHHGHAGRGGPHRARDTLAAPALTPAFTRRHSPLAAASSLSGKPRDQFRHIARHSK